MFLNAFRLEVAVFSEGLAHFDGLVVRVSTAASFRRGVWSNGIPDVRRFGITPSMRKLVSIRITTKLGRYTYAISKVWNRWAIRLSSSVTSGTLDVDDEVACCSSRNVIGSDTSYVLVTMRKGFSGCCCASSLAFEFCSSLGAVGSASAPSRSVKMVASCFSLYTPDHRGLPLAGFLKGCTMRSARGGTCP